MGKVGFWSNIFEIYIFDFAIFEKFLAICPVCGQNFREKWARKFTKKCLKMG